jgi:hypothetical protein
MEINSKNVLETLDSQGEGSHPFSPFPRNEPSQVE